MWRSFSSDTINCILTVSSPERCDVPKLPENSVLDLEDYLAMQRAIGEKSRYRILAELLREVGMSATELVDVLEINRTSSPIIWTNLLMLDWSQTENGKNVALTVCTPMMSQPRWAVRPCNTESANSFARNTASALATANLFYLTQKPFAYGNATAPAR